MIVCCTRIMMTNLPLSFIIITITTATLINKIDSAMHTFLVYEGLRSNWILLSVTTSHQSWLNWCQILEKQLLQRKEMQEHFKASCMVEIACWTSSENAITLRFLKVGKSLTPKGAVTCWHCLGIKQLTSRRYPVNQVETHPSRKTIECLSNTNTSNMFLTNNLHTTTYR